MDLNKFAMEETFKNDQARAKLFDTVKKLSPEFLIHFTNYLLSKETQLPYLSSYQLLEYELARQLIREYSVEIINHANEENLDKE